MLKTGWAVLLKIMPTLIGLYIAMFWVADARYNNAITRLEARTTNLITRLESDQWKKAIELVPTIQNRAVPYQPIFFNPISIIISLIPYFDEIDLEIVEELQHVVASRKRE